MEDTPALDIKLVPISDLRPAPWLARTISDDGLNSLARSLDADRQLLWMRPLVAEPDGTVYLGGAKLLAAELLGWKDVPVVFAPASEILAKERAIKDNHVWRHWEPDPLAKLVSELQAEDRDLGALGFDQAELDRLLEAQLQVIAPDLDSIPPVPIESVTRSGDRIELGGHVILCGDSRVPSSMETLMAGKIADAIITDAPYGVDLVGRTRDRLKIANDTTADLADLLSRSFAAVDAVLRPGAPVYAFHPAGPNSLTFGKAFVDQGWSFRQTLVWVKNRHVLGRSDYQYAHEPILFGYKPPTAGGVGRGRKGWFGGNAASSVLHAPSPHASPDHPTTKPVSLLATFLHNSTSRGDIVLDPFLGSGSTLIAAESLGRRCYGVEIDPRYVDVAVRRWEFATGNTAIRPR